MADLIFTTKGQAEALSAQEAVTKKAREAKAEFEATAKATGDWNTQLSRLKSSAESALRSVKTEQEKIAEQIDKIKQAQEKGLVPPKEAEESVARLTKRWVEADEATLKQKEDADRVAAAHDKLKHSAEAALGSVATDSERAAKKIKEIETSIDDVRAAMKEGFIPKDKGEEAIGRLKDKIVEVGHSMEDVETHHGGHLEHALKHIFDPAILIKFAGGFIGVHAALHLLEDEYNALQEKIDRRIARFQKPLEREESLKKDVEDSRADLENAKAIAMQAERNLSPAEQQAEKDKEQQAKEIEAAKKQLTQAEHDKSRTDQEITERNADRTRRQQRDREDAQREVEEAKEDYLRNPASISVQRRIANANRHLNELPGDQARENTEAGESDAERRAAAQRSIEDLKQRLDEQQKKVEEVSEQYTVATIEAVEARARAAALDRKYAETVGRLTDVHNSPEMQRAYQIQARDKALEEGNKIAANAGGVGFLSSEELKSVTELVTALGGSRLQLNTDQFLKRVTTGGVSMTDVVSGLQELLRNARVDAVGHAESTQQGAFWVEANDQAKKQVTTLEQILTVMRQQAADGGFMVGPE